MDQKTSQFIFLFLVALGYAEKLKTSSIKQWLVSIHFCKSEDETCDQSLSRQSSTVCQKPIFSSKIRVKNQVDENTFKMVNLDICGKIENFCRKNILNI